MSFFSKKTDQSYFDAFKEKLNQYKDSDLASEWLDKNKKRVQALFENHRLRDFILEPFKNVFTSPPKEMDHHIYGLITQVAIVNAVLAGLPGRMGVGIYVVMALEGWMAFRIARFVGIEVKTTKDIWKYFGALAASVGVILYAFRTLLGFAISLISIVPGVNPLIFAEFFVTDLVGILFLIGFKETKATGSFSIPTRMVMEIGKSTKDLFTHQYQILESVLTPANIKTASQRVVAYLRGDFPIDMRQINGEGFATVAMGYLLSGQPEKLEGPLGEAFLEAIRLRWSAQLGPDATTDEIANLFQDYTPEQMVGVVNTVKGKMFEIMVTNAENNDGDAWTARMHTDESFPGSDIIFTNEETGEQLEISLKAVGANNPEIIESALSRYPDISIMTTDEVAQLYEDDPRVFGSGISNEELSNITEENIERLIDSIEPVNQYEVVFGGVAVGTTAILWPFVMAYLRGKIPAHELEKVFKHVLGEAGVTLASRLTYATIFGPLFAWYLLARGVKGMVEMVDPSKTLYVEYVKG
jgi:hypothetical protein